MKKSKGPPLPKRPGHGSLFENAGVNPLMKALPTRMGRLASPASAACVFPAVNAALTSSRTSAA